MKRSTGNLLTVVFSLLVFAAGAIFAFYLLPVITDDREESIQTFSTTINTPQEIVENPKNMISCLEFFPQSYSNRKLVDSSELNEMDLQNMKLFLTSLGNQANLLFNVRIDSVILERYIQIWQYHSNSSSDDARTDDIYYIDLLFLDARSVQWRITAGGYSDEIFYLSCLEQDKEPSTPVFPTQISSPSAIHPSQKLDRMSSSFWSRLVSSNLLGSLFHGENDYQALQIPIFSYGTPNVYWKIHLESDGKYLLSAYSKENTTPICYSYLNIQLESGQIHDPLWSTY